MSAPFDTTFNKFAPNALETLRHSAAHIMARAVMRLFPDVQLAFGPAAKSDDDAIDAEFEVKK